MMKRRVFVLALVVAACDAQQVGPGPATRGDAVVFQHEDKGPPAPHAFGPDTRRTGLFTGEGVTRPGLRCDGAGPGGRVCSGFLASAVDGTLLDMTIMLPRGGQRHPLVVIMHGWGGNKDNFGDVAAVLVGEGYAVLRYSARGFGESWGQANLADIHVELEDLRSIVGQVVDQRGLRLDVDAVAIAGPSYGGGHSWLALLEPAFSSPRGEAVRIRTVVPVVGWSDLLYSLIPNGRSRRSVDVAGGAKLSYVNGLFFGGTRTSPSRPYPNYPDYMFAWHAWISAMEPNDADPMFRRIEDGTAGYRSIWWQQDFWRQAALRRVPVLQIHGFTDDLFPLSEAKRMAEALLTIDPSYPITSYVGDLGHPRASNKPEEFAHVLRLLSSWLAFYLKGEGMEPAHVIHAAITRPREQPFNPGDVITAASFDALAARVVAREFPGSATLINPLSDPLAGFFWDPLVMEAAHELRPLPVPPPTPIIETSLAAYEVAVAELSGCGPLLIAGQPSISFSAATAAHRVQLNARLITIGADGRQQLITRGTFTLDSGTVGVPVGSVAVTIPTFGNVWEAGEADVLRLEISNLDSPFITPSRVPSVTTISDVRLDVPVR